MSAAPRKSEQRKSLTPLQRRGEVARSLRLNGTTLIRTLRDEFHVSHCHFYQVMDGGRKPSRELAVKIARFVGLPLDVFWGQTEFNETNQYLNRQKQRGLRNV